MSYISFFTYLLFVCIEYFHLWACQFAMASRRRYSSKQVVDILFALPSDEEVSEDEDDEVVTQRQTLFSCF